MSRSCQTWIAQADRLALGETLSPSELAFQREHGASCDTCRAEGRFWDALEQSLEGAELLSAAPHHAASERPRWRERALGRRSLGLALLAALAGSVAGAVWLGLHWFEAAHAARPAPAVAPALPARLAFVSGEARVNRDSAAAGQALVPGDTLEVVDGRLCLSLPVSVTVCAGEGTKLVLRELSAERRRIRLESGHVVARLAPQPPGTSFGVETVAGPLVAKGTIFAVEASRQDGVRLRVHEGTVVNEGARAAQSFVAPAAAHFVSTAEREALSGDLAARDTALIELARLWPDEASCTLDVRATPAGGRITLDGALLGRTPMTALVRPGSYRLTLEQPGFAPVAERLGLRAAERVVRHYELVPLAAPEPAPAASARAVVSSAPAASAAALLAQARELRAAGRYGDAQATYSRLVAQHPNSAEAKAALVSLGELELTQLGNARAALKAFEAYLRSGGGLAQEASYGKIRALRKLGRFDEERCAGSPR